MRPYVEYVESSLDVVPSHPLSPPGPFDTAPTRTVGEFVGIPPTPSELDETFIDPSMIIPFAEPSIQLSTANSGGDPTQIQTFFSGMAGLRQSTMFKTEQYQLTPGEFREGLVRIASVLDITADWHSVRYLNDWRGGMGIETFFNRLQTLIQPVDDPEEQFDDVNPAVYLAKFDVNEYLLVELMVNRATRRIESCTITCLTTESPVDDKFYRSLAANFGVGDLQRSEAEVEAFTIEPELTITLTLRDRLVARREDDAKQFVTGVIVENPLKDDSLRQQVIDQTTVRTETTVGEMSLSQELASYDLAYTRLTEPHPREETHEHQIEGIRVHRLDSVFEWDSVWNIEIITAR